MSAGIKAEDFTSFILLTTGSSASPWAPSLGPPALSSKSPALYSVRVKVVSTLSGSSTPAALSRFFSVRLLDHSTVAGWPPRTVVVRRDSGTVKKGELPTPTRISGVA